MSSRRLLVLVAVPCLLAACAPAEAHEMSRADRVALVERRMWDRYGSLGDVAEPAVHSTSEAAALADMIAHHEDAIAGARALLESPRLDPGVRSFAERIVRVQSDQVDTMSSWLDEWYPSAMVTSHWSPMFADPRTTTDETVFLETMIDHHEHAIAMYAGWVTAGLVTHHELGVLASRIAKGQEGEIAAMEQLIVLVAQPVGADAAS